MKIRSPLVPAICVISVSFAAAWAAPDKPVPGSIAAPDTNVVARVGELDVKLDEVKAALAKLDPREQEAIAKDPALMNQVVRLILVQRLMLNEALAKKWEEKPQVKAAVERARETAITESYLQSVSQPAPGYPSETELEIAYDQAKPALAVGRQWKLAQIYIAAPEGIAKPDLEKAEAKLAEVKKALADKTADFAAIAKKHSDESESAAQGGEIGWMVEAQIQPEIREAATKLTAGAQSDAVRLKDGWHILRCQEIREPSTPPLEKVRAVLTERMRQERAKANSQAYISALLQQNPVSINEVSLAKALAK
ncbi:MAG: peptidyl-prolyl cis-trans isomerase [Verrucomicrobiales bacterium]|nr:peptidyl-prolyl cis-trans isomerase [Verrucomicrobiales bacterium]